MTIPTNRPGKGARANVVTLLGKAPRVPEVPRPEFGLRYDSDQRADYYALSNADEALRRVMAVGTAEGRKAALDLLDHIRGAVETTFKL